MSSPPPMTLDSLTDVDASRASPNSTPKLTSSALPSSVTLGDDVGEGAGGGDDVKYDKVESPSSASGSSASRLTSAASSVANIARRPKAYLGLAPLTSMFRRSSSSAGKALAKAEDGEVPQSQSQSSIRPPASSSMEDTSDMSSASEDSEDASSPSNEDDDEDEAEEDDRRTIRGVSAPVTPVDAVDPKFGIGKGLQLLGRVENDEEKRSTCNAAGDVASEGAAAAATAIVVSSR